MNSEALDRIVHSLLYEGYVLYPYRPPSLKNPKRFNYGTLYPPGSEGESSSMQTECVVIGNSDTKLQIEVRFLHLIDGTAEQRGEVEECSVPVNTSSMKPQMVSFAFGGRNGIKGSVGVRFSRCADSAFRVSVEVANRSEIKRSELRHSFVSTHTILHVREGEFVSLLDPPEELTSAVAACRNVGTWPVFLGESGARDCILSSPIILYDYPQLAPDGAGDFFDGTEIDELVALGVLTLTDEEKREIEQGGRAKQILDLIESLPPERLMKLRGAIRDG